MNHITLEELNDWQAKGIVFQLIDVREPEEHEQFNIGGTLIPLDVIVKKGGGFDSKNPVILYCKRGIRSQIAIQRLQRKHPKVNFYNLSGGIYPMLQQERQE